MVIVYAGEEGEEDEGELYLHTNSQQYSKQSVWWSELYSTFPDMLGLTGKLVFPR